LRRLRLRPSPGRTFFPLVVRNDVDRKRDGHHELHATDRLRPIAEFRLPANLNNGRHADATAALFVGGRGRGDSGVKLDRVDSVLVSRSPYVLGIAGVEALNVQGRLGGAFGHARGPRLLTE
jgi:hypothetical protein